MRTIAVVALLAASCSGPTSEIVLVVDTNVVNAAALRVTVVSPSGRSRTSTADLVVQPPPRTLVLVHSGGELGPLRVTFDALDPQGRALVSVSRELAFEEGRTLRLSVFIAEACRSASCPVVDTCGNAGECRSPAVGACEYEGGCIDAGNADAGPPDAGPCDLLGASVCGVAERYLPGDLVTPVLCAPIEGTIVSVTGPDGAIVAEGSGFRVMSSGAHEARIAMAGNESCAIARSFEVAAPLVIAGTPSGDPRDLAARLGTGFVAANGGAYAVDANGWHDLRAVADSFIVAPSDLSAVAILAGHPYFGPRDDIDAVYRIVTSPPFTTATHTSIALPWGSREVRRFGIRVDGEEPLLVGTKDGAVLITRAGEIDPSAQGLAPAYDANAWAAIATRESTTLGAVWLGKADQLVNVSVTGLGALNGGGSVSIPGSLRNANAALIDDRDELAQRLWICGDHEVAVFDLAALAGRSTLPEPIAIWTGTCHDLAMDVERTVWIAASESVVRLDASGVELARYDVLRGLPQGLVIEQIAVASSDTAREVWMLAPGASTVLALSADALP